MWGRVEHRGDLGVLSGHTRSHRVIVGWYSVILIGDLRFGKF